MLCKKECTVTTLSSVYVTDDSSDPLHQRLTTSTRTKLNLPQCEDSSSSSSTLNKEPLPTVRKRFDPKINQPKIQTLYLGDSLYYP